MRVAYFADLLYYRIAAGSTRYAGELARHLERVPGLELRLFSLHPQERIEQLAAEREYPTARSLNSRLPRRLHLLLWHAAGVPALPAAALEGADLVHAPDLLVPPRGRCPLVVTVLDLSFRLFPAFHTRRLRMLIGLGFRRALREADAFIAISRHTARDLIRQSGVSESRVHVIPLAAHERFAPVPEEGVREVLARYGIDAPYVLYLGTLEPRKNLPALLRAFAQLPQRDAKLVLAGSQGWRYGGVYDIVEQLGVASRVIFTGFVRDSDLPALLAGASVFVYPSFYEGFGLPVLEAMSCGAPVITSNVASLPEVVGDAALLVDPHDVAALRDALRRVLEAPALREELRGRGLERAARFSWQRTAQETAAAYERVLAGR